LPASDPGDTGTFSYALHTIWIPLSGLLLRGASAALFVIGFLFARRDRAHVDPGQRPILGLATLAFAVSAGVAGILTFLGVTAGLVYSPDFYVANGILNVGLSIAIGLSLYWLLLGEGVRQARLAGVIAPRRGLRQFRSHRRLAGDPDGRSWHHRGDGRILVPHPLARPLPLGLR